MLLCRVNLCIYLAPLEENIGNIGKQEISLPGFFALLFFSSFFGSISILSYSSAAFSSDSEHQEYRVLPAPYSVSLLNSRVLLNAESSLMQYSFKWIVVSRDSMPQHSCFYRQKISLPLFGMWGA